MASLAAKKASAELRRRWDEARHPRGKSHVGTNEGSFIEGGGASSRPVTLKLSGRMREIPMGGGPSRSVDTWRERLTAISRNPDKEALEGFMREWHAMSSPHPFDPRQRLIGLSPTNPSIGVELSPWEGNIHISSIISYRAKGKGEGTAAMKALMRLADKYRVRLEGTAKAISSAGDAAHHTLTTAELKKWYRRLGFELHFDQILYTPPSLRGG